MANEGKTVWIYDSIFYQAIQGLDGHMNGIRDISISENDLFVVTTCISGAVIMWKLLDGSND